MTTDPYDFLTRFWQSQPDAPVGFLAHKDWDNDRWTEHPIKLPVHRADLPEDNDLYFAPCLFGFDRRLKQHAAGGEWLFADLDEVDPRGLGFLPPHLAWETSPGRFQAAWHLDEPLGPKAWERLNRAVTYRTGADKGGWSLTKVLRIPGSVSTKHGDEWTVRLVREDWDGTVDAATVRAVCSRALPATDPATGKVRLPRTSAREIRREHWPMLSGRARKLIRVKTVRPDQDRSAKLWELHNLCLDAGMTTGETVKVVQDTVWNKYRGQRRELRMLMSEASRAEALQREKGIVPERRGGTGEVPENSTGEARKKRHRRHRHFLPFQKFMKVEHNPSSWLVDGIWDIGAFGWWAGEFKAYKTWTVLDFAVSVASGKPFLGRYEVKEPGTVMYLHDEGKPGQIHDQLYRILASKGIGPQSDPTASDAMNRKRHYDVQFAPDLPLFISSMPRLDLTLDEDKNWLEDQVRKYQPRAVILESWYLMTGTANENVAVESNPIMKWLMKLSDEENCALLMSHHFNKAPSGEDERTGTRMSGSTNFLRSYESVVYLERKGKEADHTVRLESQHRGQEGIVEMLRIDIDREVDEDFNVHFLTREEQEELNKPDHDVAGSTGGRGTKNKTDLSQLGELEEGVTMKVSEAAKLLGCSITTIKNRHRDEGLASGYRVVVKGKVAWVVGINGNTEK